MSIVYTLTCQSDITSVVHLGQAAVSLGNHLVNQKEFKNLTEHMSPAGHAAGVLLSKLNMDQQKTNAAAMSMKVSHMWQPNGHHLQSANVTSLLAAKLQLSQSSLQVAPFQQSTSASYKAKLSVWDAVTGVFDSFIDGVLSVFHLTSNRHMEA